MSKPSSSSNSFPNLGLCVVLGTAFVAFAWLFVDLMVTLKNGPQEPEPPKSAMKHLEGDWIEDIGTDKQKHSFHDPCDIQRLCDGFTRLYVLRCPSYHVGSVAAVPNDPECKQP